ncbi:KAP family P-loop NTPase fold protein [Microbacterium hominis]|uniref:KAP NTPase domain-containing protein n=1 Tax=Microbacterium hominis TaxID=162426 RepID=A0A0B4CVC8_9MICO|nr:P-loop NTPase fold protein [Microbacterium hominis]KIC58261.1 hypothetical protein RM52_05905 [Microbacterium hominis]
MSTAASNVSRTRTSQGLSDRPQAQDYLELGRYIDGLADFIRQCATPLTLAIQGDWGSGKTNTMLLIERALSPTARLSTVHGNAERRRLAAQLTASSTAPLFTISFNTWQYSQFDLDGQLAVMMLQTLVAELEKIAPEPDSKQKWAERLLASSRYAKMLTNALANIVSKATLGVSVGELVSVPATSGADEMAHSAFELLGMLRQHLSELVSAAVENPADPADKGRIVIFVDDLDRLEPRRAVELMETLKIFLDLDHCVFVLAIDFDVVAQGVSDKYGSNRIDAKKARSFFDKIIQVPFHMPVANYQVETLLLHSCASAGIELNDDQRTQFRDLIGTSVRNNPRSIKRLINTLMLLRGILGTQIPVERLFAVLCLQLAHPHVFADLGSDAFTEPLLAVFAQDDGLDSLPQALSEDIGMDADAATGLRQHWGLATVADCRAMQAFAVCLRRVFTNAEGDFDRESFLSALLQSAITGTRSDSSDERPPTHKWGHKFYLSDERFAAWQDRFATEPKLRATYKLAERLVDRLVDIDLPRGLELAVGMQVGNTRHWTIECGGRRIGLLEVHQKFFHVYFGPRAWMRWHGEPVTDDRTGLNEFCRKAVTSADAVEKIADVWSQLLTERLDLDATFPRHDASS